jgi:hypothetical protein
MPLYLNQWYDLPSNSQIQSPRKQGNILNLSGYIGIHRSHWQGRVTGYTPITTILMPDPALDKTWGAANIVIVNIKKLF